MTINQAIAQLDGLKFNTYSHQDKVRWLNTLDATIKRLVIDVHEGGEEIPFEGYDANTDGNEKLLVEQPFDEIYIRWMEAMVDYHNGEINNYNSAISLYNTVYDQFCAWYGRTHVPKSAGKRFIF